MSEITKKQSIKSASISYYVVNKGLIPGIYTSWTECKKQVDGFKNPIYRKFDNKKDAITFHNLEIDLNKTDDELIINPFENNNKNVNDNENENEKKLKDFKKGISVSQFISENGTNNLAELSAVLYGLNYIEKNNINKSCFVCDSKYAINCITVWSNNWKKNNWMTSKKTKVENLEIIQEILNIYEKLLKNNFQIKFKHVNSHQIKPKNININSGYNIEKSYEYFLWFGNDMADKNANI